MINDYSNEIQENLDAYEIGIWENEGGAPGRDDNHQCGRRVEPDRSRTVYHLLMGVPAKSGGGTLIGLGGPDATGSMMSLGNAGRRNGRLTLDAPTMDFLEIGKI